MCLNVPTWKPIVLSAALIACIAGRPQQPAYSSPSSHTTEAKSSSTVKLAVGGEAGSNARAKAGGTPKVSSRITTGVSPTTVYAAPAQARIDERAPKPVLLHGDVSAIGVLTEEVQASYGFSAVKVGTGGARVTDVRLNSHAQRSGLKEGDAILDTTVDSSGYKLTVKRDNKVVVLPLGVGQNQQNGRYTAMDPATGTAPTTAPAFRAKIDQFAAGAESRQMSALSNYNFEIIIDRSRSMQHRDCPGGLSRWQWCGMQAAEITRALAPFSKTGHTITRFASEFDVHEHVNADVAADLLSRIDFQLGTMLAEPLAARLDNYFRYRKPGDKPLLIAVITDGCPAPRPEPRMVVDTLVRASHLMQSPNEVTIVFLQVGGDDPRGQMYLTNLSTRLVSYGAKYQFVQTKTFDHLLQVGLARALVESVTQRPQGSSDNSQQRGTRSYQ